MLETSGMSKWLCLKIQLEINWQCSSKYNNTDYMMGLLMGEMQWTANDQLATNNWRGWKHNGTQDAKQAAQRSAGQQQENVIYVLQWTSEGKCDVKIYLILTILTRNITQGWLLNRCLKILSWFFSEHVDLLTFQCSNCDYEKLKVTLKMFCALKLSSIFGSSIIHDMVTPSVCLLCIWSFPQRYGDRKEPKYGL